MYVLASSAGDEEFKNSNPLQAKPLIDIAQASEIEHLIWRAP